MTEQFILHLHAKDGTHVFTSMVGDRDYITDEIARCARVLGERFQSATVHRWERVNSAGPHLGWYCREVFEWRG